MEPIPNDCVFLDEINRLLEVWSKPVYLPAPQLFLVVRGSLVERLLEQIEREKSEDQASEGL